VVELAVVEMVAHYIRLLLEQLIQEVEVVVLQVLVNFAAGGGKGVVILSMPLASFSNTTTGSPTEATSGANKF
jgi:hypothetical protein